MAIVQYPPLRNLHDMKPNAIAQGSAATSITPSGTLTLLTVNGTGVVGPFDVAYSNSDGVFRGTAVELVVDGVTYALYSNQSGNAYVPHFSGNLFAGGASFAAIVTSRGLYKYRTSFTIQLRNLSASQASLTGYAMTGVYYT